MKEANKDIDQGSSVNSRDDGEASQHEPGSQEESSSSMRAGDGVAAYVPSSPGSNEEVKVAT